MLKLRNRRKRRFEHGYTAVYAAPTSFIQLMLLYLCRCRSKHSIPCQLHSNRSKSRPGSHRQAPEVAYIVMCGAVRVSSDRLAVQAHLSRDVVCRRCNLASRRFVGDGSTAAKLAEIGTEALETTTSLVRVIRVQVAGSCGNTGERILCIDPKRYSPDYNRGLESCMSLTSN